MSEAETHARTQPGIHAPLTVISAKKGLTEGQKFMR